MKFPQRPKEHQLEGESVAFVSGHLPPGWTCDRPQHDYGVDLRVGLAAQGQVTGQQRVVQLKASSDAEDGDTVAIRLDVSTLNLLRNMLEVAMLVKYSAAEREAYWLLLKDFPTKPRNDQKTITIRIPKSNRISANPWNAIATHVAAVHFRKLQANVMGISHSNV